MSFLSEELAQNIVGETSQIISKEIEIIDLNGIVIASSNPSSVHETVSMFEMIREANRHPYYTVNNRTYTTLAIEHNRETIGFIKIEGYPRKVSLYGKMIKMALEAAIEEVTKETQIEKEKRLREEIVKELLKGTEALETIENKMKLLQLAPLGTRTVIVVELEHQQLTEAEKRNAMCDVMNFLYKRIEKNDLIAQPLAYTIVVIKRLKGKHDELLNLLQFDIETLVYGIEEKLGLKVKAGIGNQVSELEKLPQAYYSAQLTMQAGRTLHPDKHVYTYQMLSYYTLLTEAAKRNDYVDLLSPYQLMLEKDKTGELRDTFKAFLEANGDYRDAAEKVFIHRNTLKYRLEKITRITGKNPRVYNDMIQLYTSMLLYELRTSAGNQQTLQN